MDPNNFRRATGKFVGFSSILYTSEIFELVENILFAYADDSTLLAVVRIASQQTDLLLLPPLTGT